jgi:hydroxyacylglutathione hydrolase
LELFNTNFGDMTVNSFLVWCPNTKKAVAFDTGASGQMLLERVHELSLNLEALLITHTHADHIADLAAFQHIPCWVHEKEPCEGAAKFTMGKTWQVGDLKIESRPTHGHALAGTTYCVSGLSRKVLVVGDALFAFSMGGAKISYSEALRTNREAIFIEAADVIIAPGHGPMTTVGEQQQGNPFFAP